MQDAAVEALRNGSNYTAAFRDRFRSRRDALLEALSGSTALRASIPAGGMFTLVDVTASGLPSDNFAERALDEANVAVVPGTAFSDRGEGFIRGSFARGEAEITEGARRLRGFAEALA